MNIKQPKSNNPLKIFLFVAVCAVSIGLPAWAEANDNGKAFDLTPYKGNVVLVDFWASWCLPCRESFPWLNKIQRQKSAQGLVVIGVNVDENKQDAEQFLKQYPADFKIMYDPKGQYASYYNIPGMPTSLLFDKQGKLLHTSVGFKLTEIAEYERIIDQVLAQ